MWVSAHILLLTLLHLLYATADGQGRPVLGTKVRRCTPHGLKPIVCAVHSFMICELHFCTVHMHSPACVHNKRTKSDMHHLRSKGHQHLLLAPLQERYRPAMHHSADVVSAIPLPCRWAPGRKACNRWLPCAGHRRRSSRGRSGGRGAAGVAVRPVRSRELGGGAGRLGAHRHYRYSSCTCRCVCLAIVQRLRIGCCRLVDRLAGTECSVKGLSDMSGLSSSSDGGAQQCSCSTVGVQIQSHGVDMFL